MKKLITLILALSMMLSLSGCGYFKQKKIDEIKAKLVSGEVKVFDTAKEGFITVKGAPLTSYMADVDTDADYTADTEAVKDGYFHESEYRSAPYFDLTIDGITLVNTTFG